MARIPQYQEQFISTVVPDTTAGAVGQNIANVANLANQAISTYNQVKLAKEATTINELKTDFELSAQEYYNDMEQKRLSNPEGFSKDFDAFIKNKKSEFIESSNLSSLGKSALAKSLEGQRGKFVSNAINFEDKQQVLNFADSVERTAVKNNMLAYRAGENLNINELGNIENLINDNVLASSTFISGEQELRLSKATQTTNAYSDFIKGVAGSDLNYASQLIEDKGIQDKLGSIDEVDRLRGYISQVQSKKQQSAANYLNLGANGLKPNPALNVASIEQLDNRLNEFQIGKKDKKVVIQNTDLNNANDIVDYMNFVDNLYNQNAITTGDKQKYYNKIGEPFQNLLTKTTDEEELLSDKYEYSNQEYMIRKINDYTNDFEGEDKAVLFKNIFNEAQREGVYNDTSDEGKAKLKEISQKQTMLYLNSLGYDITEDNLKNPTEYLNQSKYERSQKRIISKMFAGVNKNPFGDLMNIQPKKKEKQEPISFNPEFEAQQEALKYGGRYKMTQIEEKINKVFEGK